MFGFIKNLIAGILNFFIGLFGGKKSGYYLELDEATEVAQDAAKKAVSKTKEVAQTVASKTKEAAQSVVSSTEKEVETAAAKDKKAAKPAVAKAEATQNGTKSATSPTEEKVKIELVQTSNGVRPEPVQPAKAEAAKKVIQEQPSETTFAPKYLVPNSTNGRRRPGANMNPFLDMARQVKPAK
ncbi:hypothetical protein F7734_45790 [Scytonema sp. UIC 10036]|uniref:hypothetical protein n=1 Tax=Scytonema sp. UIC 10036 TaxID=2304196 RepID=UPI0012DA6D12|nr:hypothetical protein [Scytonema sp. UIC 10036]MUG99220.1 hypothetical protein [Scytonema sp. UIC 10036]